MISTSAPGSAGNASKSTGASAFSSLSSQDFMKVLLTELSNQDPLQPQDSSKLLEQISNIRNIESQLSLQEQLGSLGTQSGVSSAGQMIGKFVKGLDDKNEKVEGLVTSIRIEDGKPVLNLSGGKTLKADRVTEVLRTEDQDAVTIQALLGDLQLLQTGALIGRKVTGTSDQGADVTGIVTAVRIDGGRARLQLDGGQELPVSKVKSFGNA